MVEGNRLLSGYRAKSSVQGSNPCLSASFYPISAMPVTLYVLKSCDTRKRYVGITRDLPRRLQEHRGRDTKAGQLLGAFTLIHTEEYQDYRAARAREAFLKSGQGRKWLDEIESQPRANEHA